MTVYCPAFKEWEGRVWLAIFFVATLETINWLRRLKWADRRDLIGPHAVIQCVAGASRCSRPGLLLHSWSYGKHGAL
jgi:hypothetical protein